MHPAFAPRALGRTGFPAGRIGLASSYGCPGRCVEQAFELGLNYFYWGSMRRGSFGDGLRHLMPQRERWMLVVQSYSRVAALIPWSLQRALRHLRTEYADVLLLGMWNRPIPPRILDACLALRDRGSVRHLAVSTHKRVRVPEMAAADPFDVLHFRYNAVHTGAERDIFPHLQQGARPGLVSFTSTSWKQLLDTRKTLAGERTPSAADCYRFALARPEIDVCMAAPANVTEFRDVVGALDAGPMDDSELAWMRRVGQAIYSK